MSFLTGFVVLAEPVADFLATQSKIRILVVAAPNYGHQMTAVTWVYRLRELGFHGEIELVAEPGTREKISVLMPVLPPKTHVIDKEELAKSIAQGTAAQVEMAIVPAEDYLVPMAFPPRMQPGRPVPPEELAAKRLLRMQPQAWRDGLRGMINAKGELRALHELLPLLMQLPKRVRPMSSSKEDLLNWLQTIAPGDSKNAWVAGLMSDQSFERLPFYCAHQEQVVALGLLAKAALQQKSPQPIRIWMTSTMTDFQWSNVVSGLKAEAQDGAVEFLENGNFGSSRARVQIVRLSQPASDLSAELMMTFTLPPVVNGKFSQNFMMQNGIPFIDIKYFDELQEALGLTDQVYRLARAAGSAFVDEIHHLKEGTLTPAITNKHVAAIASFLQAGKDPEIVRQFSTKKITSPHEDLIYESLFRFAEYISCESELETPPRT